MAEFCLRCFNEMDNTNYTKRDVHLSLFRELCEGCGDTRRVVVSIRRGHEQPYRPQAMYRDAYLTLAHDVRALCSRIEADSGEADPLFLLSLLDDALEKSERDLYPE